MTAAISVSGGADGIAARTEDLMGLARLLQSAATSVADVLDELNAPVVRIGVAAGAAADPCGSEQLQHEVAVLGSPFGPLADTGAEIGELVAAVTFAALRYNETEHSVATSLLGSLLDLGAGLGRIAIGDPGGRDDLYDALPGLVDAGMWGLGPLEPAYAAAVPDGHPVLHDLGTDDRVESVLAPHSLDGLVADLALRNSGRAGEISVSILVGADGRRRAIVDIPGTKSWNPLPNHDITSVGTDIRAMAGKDTAYEEGIFAALTAAGVTPEDDVMLVGHSEGGIVAIDAARDAASSGRFRVTHVVTAGSPIGRIARGLPDTVEVLALENSADVVPHADASDNPDTVDLTTVTVDEQHDSIGANHDLDDTYLPAAAAADASGNPSVDAFLRSASGFLGSATMRTHAYRLTRGF